MHGGGPPVSAGKPLATEYTQENIPLVTAGCCNLVKHIQNAKKFGGEDLTCLVLRCGLLPACANPKLIYVHHDIFIAVQVVVAINQFKTDTDAEMQAIRQASLDAGAFDAVVSNHWAEGGKGAENLANAVANACKETKSEDFKYLYDLDLPIREKVEIISKEIYGADGVDFSELAEQQMAQYESSGFGSLPICIAKTQYSFSCDASAKGVPANFRIFVREIRSCVGAGFLYPICGDIMTIPGLPTRPGFYDVDIDVNTGQVMGLF
jgi:formyltetrahydrofolate synthetase